MGEGDRRQLFFIVKTAFIALICMSLAACTSPVIRNRDGSGSERGFKLANLAKRDIDDVSELAQREVLAGLQRLAEKLYRRNPAELKKNPAGSLEGAIAALFDPVNHWHLSPRRGLDWQASIHSAFREDYAGDRIEALMKGLVTMIMASYEHKTEIYLLDNLDPQKLYNAARNLEIAAWRLANARKADGGPMLLANAIGGDGVANLSFEREFGKLIAIQDLIARIIEDKSNRAIRFTVVNVAGMVFLPI